MKYSLDSEQGLQPLNEYDLWVLPTIPWALVLRLQKNLQCLMIPRTLGWAPTLINEPHLWGASIPGDAVAKTVVLGNPGSPWWWVPVRIVFSSPLDVERLSELARRSHYVKFFFSVSFFLFPLRTEQFKYVNLFVWWFLYFVCFVREESWADEVRNEKVGERSGWGREVIISSRSWN